MRAHPKVPGLSPQQNILLPFMGTDDCHTALCFHCWK